MDGELERVYKDINCVAEIARKTYEEGCSKKEIHELNNENMLEKIKDLTSKIEQLSDEVQKVKDFQTKWVGILTFLCSLPPWVLLIWNLTRKGVQ